MNFTIAKFLCFESQNFELFGGDSDFFLFECSLDDGDSDLEVREGNLEGHLAHYSAEDISLNNPRVMRSMQNHQKLLTMIVREILDVEKYF